MTINTLTEVNADGRGIGGNARNLAVLTQAGMPVPFGVVLSLDVFTDGQLNEASATQLSDLLDVEKKYAVRSSGASEDADDASWAGQFETFLNVDCADVIARANECHNSAKARARAYAAERGEISDGFNVAVVVQEMIDPEYAGVLFTRDPVSGENLKVIEYVEGLGEELVSGRADPKRLVIESGIPDAPFDVASLCERANAIESLFGCPQDIEWAWANGSLFILQARAITTGHSSHRGYSIGEPGDLFYWGPSRTIPQYMSDFVAGIERAFPEMEADENLPSPPRTLMLFHEGRMVWLNNATEFEDFVTELFAVCEQRDYVRDDWRAWKQLADKIPTLEGDERIEALVAAFKLTERSEFALYGSVSSLSSRLSRLDEESKQEVWAAFLVPDKPTFLSRIAAELLASGDPAELAIRYPWIQDGYDGVKEDAEAYFTARLEMLAGESQRVLESADRSEIAARLGLSAEELNALRVARDLAEFMDDRKMWMMETRRFLDRSVGGIEHGWYYEQGDVVHLPQATTAALWERYVEFRASTNAVTGVVASNGNRHFVSGEVVLVEDPAQPVPADKVVVVPTTSPSYVPMMRNARALITDHGGLMSHAAIVAREFGLPCIVGTRQATKILRTGDQVVLDLVRGEVSR